MTDKGTRATRITEDDQAVLAMEASRMSLDSIASTMGWSRRRLEARLAVLKAALEAPPPVVKPVATMGAIALTIAPINRGRMLGTRLRHAFEAILAVLPAMAAIQSSREAVSSPPATPPTRTARPRRAKSLSAMRPAAALGDRQGVEVLKPLTEKRLRFCRWFHEAAWPVEEIAYLFDLPSGDLAQALGVAH